MTFQIPQALGGPILHWELIRATRLLWPRILRYGYLPFLVLCCIVGSARREIENEEDFRYRRAFPEHRAMREVERILAERTARAQEILFFLLCQQLVLILLLTPAVTAGALGHEKERGTLAALFGTELSSRQIVTGKLLGRLAVLVHTGLGGLPVLVFLACMSDLGVPRLLLALAQAGVLTFALAAVSLLCSVWTRRTSDAILACYATIILGFMVVLLVGGDLWLPNWLNPVEMLFAIGQAGAAVRPAAFALHLAAWAGAGFACLALASARLRSACLDQLERRPGRWLWAFRPPVGNDPVRWRERYVIGLAPLPWLRGVPTWLALLGVFSFSAILAGTGLDSVTHGFFESLREGQWARTWQLLGHLDAGRVLAEVTVSGVVLLVLGVPVVGVRCATSITEEKRRKTWEDLVLTPLLLEEIVRGKRWGILQAAVPYVAMYALPMFGLASLGGGTIVLWAALWLAGAGIAFVGAGVVGTWLSAEVQRSPEQYDDEQAVPLVGEK
jgi:ABC-type Na+ efflux pump permease subunit